MAMKTDKRTTGRTLSAKTASVTDASSERSLQEATAELRRQTAEVAAKVAAAARSGSLKAVDAAKSGSVTVYRVARARPRLTAGLLLIGGVAITAFVLRKRIPGAVEKLGAAAAGIAIAAGAPELFDRLTDAGARVRKSKLVTRPIKMLKDAPARLDKLSREVAHSRPVRKMSERLRRAH
jgi:hypothetical protein